ncbi:MAG: alpha/beta hydrolase [Propionibacteriaceae bacterium]|jgi:acetyl esterase/lipase|nr:alpha/beta hydrolase [Propionibacteriaceae bacterium]
MGILVEPFLGSPWLVYTPDEPSRYAMEVGLPETLERSEKYPLRPGIFLDYIDDSTPEGVIREDLVVPASGQNLFYYRYAEPKHPGDPRVVYYVHGGGFIRGNGPYCRATALWALRETGLPVYATEYRTAPDHKWPDNLDDTEAGWRYLTETLGIEPKNIITIGDSAGGMLTGALGMRLKRLGDPLPGGMIFISPALDYTFSMPAHKLNAETDPLFKGGVDPESINWWASAEHALNPEVSSYQGDWTGFPPLYFSAGEAEVWLSDSLETGKKAYESGVPVTVHVFHGMWHDWITNDYEIPEAYVVGEDIREFLGFPRQ